MKWQDIRKLYPNQFVKLKILDSYVIDNIKTIVDAEVIEVIPNDRATKELLKCRGNLIVFHLFCG